MCLVKSAEIFMAAKEEPQFSHLNDIRFYQLQFASVIYKIFISIFFSQETNNFYSNSLWLLHFLFRRSEIGLSGFVSHSPPYS